MYKNVFSLILLAMLVLTMAACNGEGASAATTGHTFGDTQAQTTATTGGDTTQPTQEGSYGTLPPVTNPDDPTQASETQPQETTGGTQSGTESTTGPQIEAPKPTSYEEYNAMTAEQQAAFYNSFANPNDFFAWMDAAKKEYEQNKDQTIVDGNTNVDLGGN